MVQSGGGDERKARAWDAVGGEMRNCRRFRNPVFEAVGRVRPKRGERRLRNLGVGVDGDGGEGDGEGEGRTGRGMGGRGRVRFEVGGRERDADGEEEGDEEGGGDVDAERLKGLLRRLWRGGIVGTGG